MTDKKWHKGPPPSLGWWPADVFRQSNILRWWDGKCWSVAYWENDSMNPPLEEAHLRRSPYENEKIEWQHRPDSWPERSKT